MRFGQMPVTLPRRLVLEQAQMNAQGTFCMRWVKAKSAGAVKAGLPPKISSISTCAGVHVLDQLPQRFDALDDRVAVPPPSVRRAALRWRCVQDRMTDVAQMAVDGMGEQVDDRRLPIARHDQRAAGAGVAFAEHCADRRPRHATISGRLGLSPASTDMPGTCNSAASAQAIASISLALTASRWSALAPVLVTRLAHVKPIHRRRIRLLGSGADAAARHEVCDVAKIAGAASQKIGVQGHDHVGTVKS